MISTPDLVELWMGLEELLRLFAALNTEALVGKLSRKLRLPWTKVMMSKTTIMRKIVAMETSMTMKIMEVKMEGLKT